MTTQSSGNRLPTTEVAPPKGLWQFVLKRLLLVAVIALIMVWAISDSRKGTIAAIEVPLLERRWRRLEEQRLASLPEGAIYAGPARAEGAPGSGSGRPVAGELILDAKGVSFTPKRTAQVGNLSFGWAEMSHIKLNPITYAPLAGSLVLTLAGGTTQNFLVQRCGSLADKLQNLSERL